MTKKHQEIVELRKKFPFMCFCCGKPLAEKEHSYLGLILCYDCKVKVTKSMNGIKG